jgi:hypothetical protein
MISTPLADNCLNGAAAPVNLACFFGTEAA